MINVVTIILRLVSQQKSVLRQYRWHASYDRTFLQASFIAPSIRLTVIQYTSFIIFLQARKLLSHL
ncbi:hypothetical protein CW304_07650 [Bacillus sp. UFRGS-B20]|nr:hypothetical protein CW304_07650 [Bacillus sp. UFRGS-B20]